MQYSNEQLDIINSDKKHIAIQAVAGSGKTTTIMGRLQRLYFEKKIKNILFVSFSRASKQVIDKRISSIGLSKHEYKSFTFDKFYFDTWKGYTPYGVKINNEIDDLLKHTDHYESYKTHINKIKDNINRFHFINSADINIALLLEMKKNPAHFEGIYSPLSSYNCIVIDEAADTSIQQLLVLKCMIKLCGQDFNIILAGDENQMISDFRGVPNISMQIMIELLHCKTYPLQKNFRSTDYIINNTNLILKYMESNQITKLMEENNQGKIEIDNDLKIYSVGESDSKHKHINLSDYRSFAPNQRSMYDPFDRDNHFMGTSRDLIDDIFDFFKGKSGSNAIICRSNWMLKKIKENLESRRIKVNSNVAKDDKLDSFYYDINRYIRSKDYSHEHQYTWEELTKEHYFNKSDIQESLLYQQHPDLFTIQDYINVLMEYERLKEQVEQAEEDPNAVYLKTIHGSKGLEFDNVFIITDGTTRDYDEAGRLLYVAMTRARKNLELRTTGYQSLSQKDHTATSIKDFHQAIRKLFQEDQEKSEKTLISKKLAHNKVVVFRKDDSEFSKIMESHKKYLEEKSDQGSKDNNDWDFTEGW